jgi:hypothetical protein
MMGMLRAPAPFVVLAVLASLGACRQLAGIEDIELSPEAGLHEGGPGMEGGRKEGGPDGPEPTDAGDCGCDKCVTLASGQSSPLSMVLVGTDIYFLNYGPEAGLGSLARVSTSGGKVETLQGGLTHPLSLTTDGMNLYYFTEDPKNGGVIEKLPISAGTLTTLATKQGTMAGLISCETIQYPTTQFITVSATDVYWIGTSGGVGVNVMTVPIAGGASKAFLNAVPGEAGLAAAFEPSAILTDGTSLFIISNDFSDYAGIIKATLSTGESVSIIEDLTTPDALALTATDLLFTDEAVSFTNGTLQILPQAGGANTVLAKKLYAPWAVTTDATDAYWINSGNGNILGSLEKVPLGGGTATTLAGALEAAEAIAIDSTSVYWIDSDCGTVMKVAK